MLERRWVPLDTVGIYVPRNLLSTLVMCAVPAQVAGVRRIVVCTPPQGAGLIAAAAELLGLDEVWALGGAAGDRLARLRRAGRPDRRAGQPVRERREARGLARRCRSTCPAARRRWSSSPTAMPTTSSSSSSWQRSASTATKRCARALRRWPRRKRLRPSISSCSVSAEREAGSVRNAGAVFVGRYSPVAAGDYATGGNHVLPTNGWARSIGGLGLETFLKPVTIQRLTADGLARIRPTVEALAAAEGDAGARGGGAAMKALAPEFRPYAWAPPSDEVARHRGHRPVAGAAVRPEHAAAAASVDAPRHDRRRARPRQRLSRGRLPGAAARDRRLRRRRAAQRRRSAPAQTT